MATVQQAASSSTARGDSRPLYRAATVRADRQVLLGDHDSPNVEGLPNYLDTPAAGESADPHHLRGTRVQTVGGDRWWRQDARSAATPRIMSAHRQVGVRAHDAEVELEHRPRYRRVRGRSAGARAPEPAGTWAGARAFAWCQCGGACTRRCCAPAAGGCGAQRAPNGSHAAGAGGTRESRHGGVEPGRRRRCCCCWAPGPPVIRVMPTTGSDRCQCLLSFESCLL